MPYERRRRTTTQSITSLPPTSGNPPTTAVIPIYNPLTLRVEQVPLSALPTGGGGGGTTAAPHPEVIPAAAMALPTAGHPVTAGGYLWLSPNNGSSYPLFIFSPGAQQGAAVQRCYTPPAGAANLQITLLHEPVSALAQAATADYTLRFRQLTSGAAWTPWSTITLASVNLTTDTNPISTAETVTLSAISMTAGLPTQFELVRENSGTLAVGHGVSQLELLFS